MLARFPFIYLFFFFWLSHTACEILIPQPGIKPVPPTLGAQHSNHWTTREAPPFIYLTIMLIASYYVSQSC